MGDHNQQLHAQQTSCIFEPDQDGEAYKVHPVRTRERRLWNLAVVLLQTMMPLASSNLNEQLDVDCGDA